MDWNDLRHFLAVAREGSTLAAGRALHVSQTTVARRIAALEEALGFPLFDKRQAGYTLTPAGEQLLDRAGQVETATLAFSEAARAHARDLSGVVRLTSDALAPAAELAVWEAALHAVAVRLGQERAWRH